MKRFFALLVVILLTMTGCSRTMDDIMRTEPCVVGTVSRVIDGAVLLECGEMEGYPGPQACWVSLDAEHADSYTHPQVGDVLTVYYDGQIAETSPLQIAVVYAITLRQPAARETEPAPEPEALPDLPEELFVKITDCIPTATVELKYASEDNFTQQTIYDFSDAYLRYGTVKKLAKAAEALAEYGCTLKIWDAYRPVSAQFRLWEACPDPRYVSNPNTGYSSHSRGNTVDVTVLDETGGELEMPTCFDDFTPMADRDYSDCLPPAARNAQLLQDIMEASGFTGYSKEWWHFTDTVEYPVEEVFVPNQ